MTKLMLEAKQEESLCRSLWFIFGRPNYAKNELPIRRWGNTAKLNLIKHIWNKENLD